MSELEDSGFHQEYVRDPKKQQKVRIFCRMCRQMFPVTVPGNPRAKVRCLCGHGGRLSEFDVFVSPERAKDFAVFYSRIIGAVKDALQEANIPLPPSGRFVPYREGFDEDESDIRSAYVESEVNNLDDYETQRKLFEHRIEAAQDDLFELHRVLANWIELSYRYRISRDTARRDCEEACKRDIELVPKLVREAKRRKRAGEASPRLTFNSFKHLAILLEEQGDFKAALNISKHAKKLGLKGYDERIERLERLLDG